MSGRWYCGQQKGVVPLLSKYICWFIGHMLGLAWLSSCKLDQVQGQDPSTRAQAAATSLVLLVCLMPCLHFKTTISLIKDILLGKRAFIIYL